MRACQSVIRDERHDALQRTAGVPIFLASELKTRLEIMAPHFPEAALIPCAVDLM